MKHLDLFSGIGGFALGLKEVGGFETIAFCEINEHARGILKRHFKNVPVYEDILKLNAKDLKADLITAGFPCQDLSVAGKKQGLEGERSGLFYETLRIADEAGAKYILYENSPQLIWRAEYRESFIKALWESGWGVVWRICSAKECGYLHKRERAFALCFRQENFTNAHSIRCFCLKRFTFSTQMASHINHQKRLYPYVSDIMKESEQEIIDLIIEIYEEMMGYPKNWSKSTP